MSCNSFGGRRWRFLPRAAEIQRLRMDKNELTPTTGKGSAGPPKSAAPAGKGGGQGHRPTRDYNHAYPPILSNKDELEKEKLHHAGERGIFRGKGGGG